MKNTAITTNTNSLLNQAKRRNLLSLSIIIVVASVASLFIIVYPQVKHVLSVRQDLAKKQDDVKQLKQKVTQLNQQLAATDYLTSNDTVQLALPNSKPLLEVLTSLDQVKRASEVELFDLETNPGLLATSSGRISSKNAAKAESLDLKFTIKATFAQVSQFMDLLEKVAPFTTISAFEISGNGPTTAEQAQGNEEELIQVTIETKTFFYNPTVKYAITTPLPKLSQENTVVIAKLAEFMAIPLPEQREITGGGSADLFGVETIEGL